jgi:aminodeoxyfutalosine synthase
MTDAILQRAADGGRITPEEAVSLYRDAPLEALGEAADAVVRRRYGDVVTYNVNAHLNPTNICVVGCGFCAFAVWTEKDERAYAYSVDQLVDRAVQLADLGITELHIVGGMTKEYDLPYYEELFTELKATLPHVSLTALTAVEVDFIARISKVSHAEALARLRAAGHDTMPGGGAEVFSPRVRKIIADRKVPAETWLAVHREAHGQGLRTNATLLFGHFETPEEQVDHMAQLRDLQDDTGGFQAFIPLAFHPDNNQMRKLPAPTATDTLRVHAVARLMLDNIAHIKAFWIMQGVGLSQVALDWGCDDLDGTVVWYDITKREGRAGTTHQELHVEDIKRLVREAGRVPVERDTLYREVRREAGTTVAEPAAV